MSVIYNEREYKLLKEKHEVLMAIDTIKAYRREVHSGCDERIKRLTSAMASIDQQLSNNGQAELFEYDDLITEEVARIITNPTIGLK